MDKDFPQYHATIRELCLCSSASWFMCNKSFNIGRHSEIMKFIQISTKVERSTELLHNVHICKNIVCSKNYNEILVIF